VAIRLNKPIGSDGKKIMGEVIERIEVQTLSKTRDLGLYIIGSLNQ
jgi:hypothetical protein